MHQAGGGSDACPAWAPMQCCNPICVVSLTCSVRHADTDRLVQEAVREQVRTAVMSGSSVRVITEPAAAACHDSGCAREFNGNDAGDRWYSRPSSGISMDQSEKLSELI